MDSQGSTLAGVLGDRGRLGMRRIASSPNRRGGATVRHRAALGVLCALVCVLIASPGRALATTASFGSSGSDQTFTVPAGVSSVEVVAGGSKGETTGKKLESPLERGNGGKGARVSGELQVMPGEKLYVEVGEAESGEASDVRTSPRSFGLMPDTRLIVAGAGGSGSEPIQVGEETFEAENGSNAGEGCTGCTSGGAGTQSSGGAGGVGRQISEEKGKAIFCQDGQRGELGFGGAPGGSVGFVRECEAVGGRGGDGYYGGGGGAEGSRFVEPGGGGGGGSSLVPPGGREEGWASEAKVQITYGGPGVVTGVASEVLRNSATLSGSVNPEGETVSDCHFEYGPTQAYGTIVPCPTSPGSGTTPVPESVEVTGLKADTTYFYRLVATNPTATRHGHNVSFATANPPTVVTDPATGVEQNTATLNATVNPEGTTLSDCHFEYGLSTAYGTSVPCSPELKPGVKEPVPVSASLTGLTLGTTYHFRIVATNLSGTSEGKDLTFLTLGSKPVVTKVSPTKGPAGGGTTVTISGKFFTGATAVRFGSQNAAQFLVKSATGIVAESPGEVARSVDVTVTTPNGTSLASSADHFKFGPPTVSSVSPNSGSPEGNNTVTVTGTGFGLGSEATLFKFGTTEATTVSCTSNTSCAVVVPSHVAGTVEVKATVSGQSSPKAVPADQYTYG